MKTQLTLLLTCWCLFAFAQNANKDTFQYQLKKLESGSISIDGAIGEGEWDDMQATSPFINKWPVDSGIAEMQSEVRVTYDDNFLYVMAINHQLEKDVIIQTLKRDNPSGHWGSDAFTVVIDPMNQENNGFLFGVNAGGAQMEAGLNVNGNQTDFDENWDNKWYSATTQTEDYWIAEMAIPFNTLRYNSENQTWGINFIRNDMKNNYYTSWAQVPIAFRGIDLSYMGSLRWDAAPKKTSGNVILIPYAAGGGTQDFEESDKSLTGDIGLDAKIGLTSSLNLDLTVNPDFSNIDVDQQVTNLTRFNVFFPEKRGFFLENSDLFTSFGTWGVTPFFSRSIGLSGGEQIPILFGARVSGNVNDNLRIGIMDVQTKGRSDLDVAANNYFVTAVQHKVWARSRIKALVTNRQHTNSTEVGDELDFNRSAGLEFDYVSKDGYLTGQAKYHNVFTPETTNENAFINTGVRYNNGKLFFGAFYTKIGENYTPDMGFVPQLYHYDPINDTTLQIGYQRYNGWIGMTFRPENGAINSLDINPWTSITYDDNGDLLERRIGFYYETQFRNRHSIEANIMKLDINLVVPADLIGGDEPLPAGMYHNNFGRVQWSSDNRKLLSGTLAVGAGKFYTGKRTMLSSSINIRRQPWGNFSINYDQNFVDLGGAYGKTVLHLVGPKAEVSFSNNMFWTTFLQYNTQAENFNINSRFQWRYKPMSDFFIVYSENYLTTNLKTKNRGIVFKLTYWLNL